MRENKRYSGGLVISADEVEYNLNAYRISNNINMNQLFKTYYKSPPSEWDWRKSPDGYNYVPQAKEINSCNRGPRIPNIPCNACVPFAAASCIESNYSIKNYYPIQLLESPPPIPNLSESYLFFEGWKALPPNGTPTGAKACDIGWTVDLALQYSRDSGMWEEDPLISDSIWCVTQPPSNPPGGNSFCKIDHYAKTSLELFAKNWLIKLGPIITGITAFQSLLDYGIHEHGKWNWDSSVIGCTTNSCLSKRWLYVHDQYPSGSAQLNPPHHAVLIIGYCDFPTPIQINNKEVEGYWIIQNPWGDDWADNGVGYVPYGECNIGMIYPFYSVYFQPGVCFPPALGVDHSGAQLIDAERAEKLRHFLTKFIAIPGKPLPPLPLLEQEMAKWQLVRLE